MLKERRLSADFGYPTQGGDLYMSLEALCPSCAKAKFACGFHLLITHRAVFLAA